MFDLIECRRCVLVETPQSEVSWWNPLSWGGKSGNYTALRSASPKGLASKPRKVPVKVEPKVFFANERTFLAWLNMAVTLSSISMAIVA
jgi:hypothetical protein